jgi:hypothetical protein
VLRLQFLEFPGLESQGFGTIDLNPNGKVMMIYLSNYATQPHKEIEGEIWVSGRLKAQDFHLIARLKIS